MGEVESTEALPVRSKDGLYVKIKYNNMYQDPWSNTRLTGKVQSTEALHVRLK